MSLKRTVEIFEILYCQTEPFACDLIATRFCAGNMSRKFLQAVISYYQNFVQNISCEIIPQIIIVIFEMQYLAN